MLQIPQQKSGLLWGHADCSGTASFEFFIGNTSIGTYNATNGCVCNTSPLVVSINTPEILALIGPTGCQLITVKVNDPSFGLYLAYARAEIDRTESGTDALCIVDFVSGGNCGDRDLCDGYGGPVGESYYTNNLPDTDGDGDPDCTDPDIDGDGVANASDNCPMLS